MARTTPRATFIGGPLDGQTYLKHNPGPWSIYLDEDGRSVRSKLGDAWARRGEGCYVHRTVQQPDGEWHEVYQHTSTLPRHH
jgi:hypothetical protein